MSEIAQIDCGYLATLQAMADDIWDDPIKNNDLIADVESALAVLQNQSVNFREITTGNKKRVLSVEWLTDCSAEVTSCSDDCTITGSDATPQCKEYEIECLGEISFQTFDRVYRERTIERQESEAFLMLSKMRALDNFVAQTILTGILAGVGVNQFTGGVGDVVGTNTYIAPQYWDDSIWGYFARVARGNKFRNPYIITGDNLFQLIWNRMKETVNADGKAGANKIASFRYYLDPENVETIAPSTTFMLHKTAVAFLNKAWYPVNGANAVQLTADRRAFSIESKNIPGIYYDVITERGCESNDFYTGVKLQLHGMFVTNPYPCDDDVTGILRFECGVSET